MGSGESLQMGVKRLVCPISVDTNSAVFVNAKMGAIHGISSRIEEFMAWEWGPDALKKVLRNARRRNAKNGFSDVTFEDFEDSNIRLDPEVWAIILYLDPRSSFDNGVRLDEARRRAVELIRATTGPQWGRRYRTVPSGGAVETARSVWARENLRWRSSTVAKVYSCQRHGVNRRCSPTQADIYCHCGYTTAVVPHGWVGDGK